MILQALHGLYDRLESDSTYGMASPGFSLQKITFKVVLHPDGRLLDIQDARLPVEGKLRAQQVQVLGQTKPSGMGLNPCFLWDNCGYLLGWEVEPNKRKRAAKTFEAFKARHLGARAEIGAPAFEAVCKFLESWTPARATSYPALEDAAQTGFGVFQIVGKPAWVHDDPKVVAWWKAQLAGSPSSEVAGQCLLTGGLGPLARLHDKVKNLAGGQGSGSSLVGFNEAAFESYGKQQSFNAPVSEEAAHRYMAALNALLDGPRKDKHRLTLGDMTVVFWTDQPTATEDIFARFAGDGSAALEDPEAQDEAVRARLEALLRALREGRSAYSGLGDDVSATRYSLLGLSPNAGRVAVRLFQRESLADLLDHLRQHHQDIGLLPQAASGKRRADPEFPPTWMLLRQTAREAKDIPPLLAGPLLRAVLTGGRYPDGLFSAVIRRIRADRVIDYPRACVLKGYLNRNLNQEVSMSLDTRRPDPAYRLGRLFAALEKTQKDALGEGLNTTIRDSYYSSASATPAIVFPRLLRVYQHHLAKLEAGRRVTRERLVQEIFDPMAGFPAHLSLPDQGLFAIGYYHQNRAFYTKRSEADDAATAHGGNEE